VQGAIDPHTGWVRDFAEIKAGVAPIIDMLDHHNLNDIPGLEQSTVENLAVWLWPRLRDVVPGLVKITVWETATSGCEYAGA
jgi:6-pyruvoyl-tetrahydropterin synthase